MRSAMLIFHLLGLTLGLGSSFIYLFTSMAKRKMDQEAARTFTVNTYLLGTMGHIGLTLSILTGFYLMTPFWSTLSDRPLLIAKLIFVALFTLGISLTSVAQGKAKKEASESIIKRINLLSAITLLSGLVILVLAVLVFK